MDRTGYASFWLSVMEKRDLRYALLFLFLTGLCSACVTVFVKLREERARWQVIYMVAAGYLLLDLGAILARWPVWTRLVYLMEAFDETLEHSDFTSWFALRCAPDDVDELTYDTTLCLQRAADQIDQIAKRAWKKRSQGDRWVFCCLKTTSYAGGERPHTIFFF